MRSVNLPLVSRIGFQSARVRSRLVLLGLRAARERRRDGQPALLVGHAAAGRAECARGVRALGSRALLEHHTPRARPAGRARATRGLRSRRRTHSADRSHVYLQFSPTVVHTALYVR